MQSRFAKYITIFFDNHIAMCDVMVYGAPKVGHNLEEANKRIMSSFCLHNLQCHEKSYHLDSIKVYLKGMYLFVIENWTPNDR